MKAIMISHHGLSVGWVLKKKCMQTDIPEWYKMVVVINRIAIIAEMLLATNVQLVQHNIILQYFQNLNLRFIL